MLVLEVVGGPLDLRGQRVGARIFDHGKDRRLQGVGVRDVQEVYPVDQRHFAGLYALGQQRPEHHEVFFRELGLGIIGLPFDRRFVLCRFVLIVFGLLVVDRFGVKRVAGEFGIRRAERLLKDARDRHSVTVIEDDLQHHAEQQRQNIASVDPFGGILGDHLIGHVLCQAVVGVPDKNVRMAGGSAVADVEFFKDVLFHAVVIKAACKHFVELEAVQRADLGFQDAEDALQVKVHNINARLIGDEVEDIGAFHIEDVVFFILQLVALVVSLRHLQHAHIHQHVAGGLNGTEQVLNRGRKTVGIDKVEQIRQQAERLVHRICKDLVYPVEHCVYNAFQVFFAGHLAHHKLVGEFHAERVKDGHQAVGKALAARDLEQFALQARAGHGIHVAARGVDKEAVVFAEEQPVKQRIQRLDDFHETRLEGRTVGHVFLFEGQAVPGGEVAVEKQADDIQDAADLGKQAVDKFLIFLYVVGLIGMQLGIGCCSIIVAGLFEVRDAILERGALELLIRPHVVSLICLRRLIRRCGVCVSDKLIISRLFVEALAVDQLHDRLQVLRAVQLEAAVDQFTQRLGLGVVVAGDKGQDRVDGRTEIIVQAVCNGFRPVGLVSQIVVERRARRNVDAVDQAGRGVIFIVACLVEVVPVVIAGQHLGRKRIQRVHNGFNCAVLELEGDIQRLGVVAVKDQFDREVDNDGKHVSRRLFAGVNHGASGLAVGGDGQLNGAEEEVLDLFVGQEFILTARGSDDLKLNCLNGGFGLSRFLRLYAEQALNDTDHRGKIQMHDVDVAEIHAEALEQLVNIAALGHLVDQRHRRGQQVGNAYRQTVCVNEVQQVRDQLQHLVDRVGQNFVYACDQRIHDLGQHGGDR